MANRDILLFSSAILAGLLYLSATVLYQRYLSLKVGKLSQSGSVTPEETEESLPNPAPLLDFNLETAQTRNYVVVNKCIRWPYFQTMAHQALDING